MFVFLVSTIMEIQFTNHKSRPFKVHSPVVSAQSQGSATTTRVEFQDIFNAPEKSISSHSNLSSQPLEKTDLLSVCGFAYSGSCI